MAKLVTGEPKIAALGLEEYVPVLKGFKDKTVTAMEAEFKEHDRDTGDGKTLLWWFEYVSEKKAVEEKMKWGSRDSGHAGLSLDDFVQMRQAQDAKLSVEHVLALRLYTCTPVSFVLNNPLRAFKRDTSGNVLKPVQMEAEHPFPVTIFLIHEAIKR